MYSYFSKLISLFKPYLYLMRVQAPTGMWLLLFPCWWGLALGTSRPSFFYMGLFALGAFVMRSAGCVINDWIDRDLDRYVERTRTRPFAAGVVSLRGGIVLLIGLLVVGLLVLLALPLPAQVTSLLLAVGIVIYPFLKRVTYFPPLFLGMIFKGGLLVGWLTVQPHLTPRIGALYLAAMCWTLGYDTLYALQDIEDDPKVGIKSLALWLGPYVWEGILSFYLLFCGIGGIVALSGRQWGLGGSLVVVAVIVITFYRRRPHVQSLPALAELFRKNIWVGAFVLSGIFLDNVLK